MKTKFLEHFLHLYLDNGSLSIHGTGFDTDDTSGYLYRASFFAFIPTTFIVQKMFNATWSADSRYKSAVLPPSANSKTRTNLDTRIEDLSSGHQITLSIVLICSGQKVDPNL